MENKIKIFYDAEFAKIIKNQKQAKENKDLINLEEIREERVIIKP